MTSNPIPPLPPTSGRRPVMGYQGAATRACPGCGGGPLGEPSFTWWGGMIGHKLLGVERCESCRKWWVKSTGQPGGGRVTVYAVIGIVLGLAIGVAWAISQAR